MMTLILHFILYKKKIIAMGLLLGVYVVLLCMIAVTSDTTIDRLLYPEETYLYYDMISKLVMKFILTASLATIAFDFNAPYDEPLFAYFSKSHVTIVKLCIYVLLISLVVISANIIRLGIGMLVYEIHDQMLFYKSFYVIYDMLILMFWMFIITPKKYKQAAFLIVVSYVVVTMLQEDLSNVYVYYLIPFFHARFSMYELSHIYMLIYGLILVFMVYLKGIKHEQ